MEKIITSVNNELVKNTVKLQQKKYRDESGKFLLEGYKAIKEASSSGIELEYVFVVEKNSEDFSEIKSKLIYTTEAILKKVSTTNSAPEAVAVGIQKTFKIDDIKFAKKIVLLENIKDLGNLGTILRSATAFSIDAVILLGETVDVYNPKCVRSAVGNLWKIPVVHIKDLKTLEKYFGNFEKVATLPKSNDTIFLKDYKPQTPYLIMFGAEADGLSQELIDFSSKKVTIEMNESVESLNLSISVGIFLYKISIS